MEKIETKTRFVVQLLAVSGGWYDCTSSMTIERAERKKREREEENPTIKFRIVRATTTYEVMEEAK